MTRFLRVASLILMICCFATPGDAIEVSLQLTSATYVDCHMEGGFPPHDSPEEVCGTPVAAALLPAVPEGHGSVIDIDAAGITIRAILQLDSFSLDGTTAGPWALAFAIVPGDYPSFDPGQLALPGQYSNGAWRVRLTRMADQSDFSGEFELAFDQDAAPWRRWVLTFSFEAIATGAPPPCLGELLYLDDDGDGEVNSRDASPYTMDARFGSAVDADGRTPVEFCSAGQSPRPNRLCGRLDYGNDEPLRRRPADCQPMPDNTCQPAEFFSRSQPPAAPSRTCLGYAVIDDADGDGEPDATDLCANTPGGSAIDGDGCSAQQFCSQQSVLSCRRADFRNDEPYLKKPGDCARTRSRPRACTAATRS